jgi:microcystin-dependent protein
MPDALTNPYLGEIRMIAGYFAPAGWMFCEGQTLSIALNDALFQLIGTTYGGDGEETFMLPDLRGRVPVHAGTSSTGTTFTQGEQGGTETVTLTTAQIPSHTHAFLATTNPAASTSPKNTSGAVSNAFGVAAYGTDPTTVNLSPSSVSSTGGSQRHNNLQPYTCVHFIICMDGIFPSQT